MSVKFRSVVFFDTKKVMSATTKTERRVMSKIGAYIRTAAKQSFGRPTKTPKPSEPGSPPRSRTGYLKRGIYFGYNINARAVVIGPIKGAKRAEVTAALEFGRGDLEARPYMGPALLSQIPKLSGMWKDSIKR